MFEFLSKRTTRKSSGSDMKATTSHSANVNVRNSARETERSSRQFSEFKIHKILGRRSGHRAAVVDDGQKNNLENSFAINETGEHHGDSISAERMDYRRTTATTTSSAKEDEAELVAVSNSASRSRRAFWLRRSNGARVNRMVPATSLLSLSDSNSNVASGAHPFYGNVEIINGDDDDTTDMAKSRETSLNKRAERRRHDDSDNIDCSSSPINIPEGVLTLESKQLTKRLQQQQQQQQGQILIDHDDDRRLYASSAIDEQRLYDACCDANTTETQLNDVKYRHSESFQKNEKDKSTAKTKRQSRFSLSLTWNLTGDKNKSSNTKEIFGNSPPSPSPLPSPLPPQTVQSIEHKSKILKRSREYLSDIFMARGRNNNRNKNKIPESKGIKDSTTTTTTINFSGNPCTKSIDQIDPDAVANGLNNNKNNTKNNRDNVTDRSVYNNSTVHLEIESSDLSLSPMNAVSTNSSQVTMPNNRQQNFLSHDQEKFTGSRRTRSNSAERAANAPLVRIGERARSLSRSGTGSSLGDMLHRGHVPTMADADDVRVEPYDAIRSTGINREGVVTVNKQTDRNLGGYQIENETIDLTDENGSVSGSFSVSVSETCAKRSRLNELAECDRDRLVQNCGRQSSNAVSSDNSECDGFHCETTTGTTTTATKSTSTSTPMGQSNGKLESSSSSSSSNGRANQLPDFRESHYHDKPNVILPKITVVDYSNDREDQEVFCDLENETEKKIDSNGYQGQPLPSMPPRNPTPPLLNRYNYVILEDVPEQEEEEEIKSYERHQPRSGSHFESPERHTLKSTNTSDSNLSTSYPDSGIGDSQSSQSQSQSQSARTEKDSHTINDHREGEAVHAHRRSTPFARDGYSTDCDEIPLRSDDFEFVMECDNDDNDASANGANERLVCIESISLPDVVVETTFANSGNGNGNDDQLDVSSGSDDREIINISGASGNSFENVHFIPIHVQGDNSSSRSRETRSHSRSHSRNNSPKHRSLDDSALGNGPTIEIIEHSTETDNQTGNATLEKLRRELYDQKIRYNLQLEDAQRNVQNVQKKVNEMQLQVEQLEKELSAKSWNVERLQGELNAAHRDDECVRRKLKLLEEDKTNLRHVYNENNEEWARKYEILEKQYKELQEKYEKTQSLTNQLQAELTAAQSEVAEADKNIELIRAALEEQIRILKNSLDNSEAERKICADRWQKEFEMLRTQNMEREETLMADCEWQLRQTQMQWKTKMDKVQQDRREALEKAKLLERELEERSLEIKHLRTYEAEVKPLRGVVADQKQSIQMLMEEIENLKAELITANENLEAQIEAVKKIKWQCDNTLRDNERQIIYRIDEVRNEAAAFWENKLYTEMTRLKYELESVFVDERREALDKLQTEHIEELRALTSRYTSNEEELRMELADIQERLDCKSEEFLEFRERSDNALLQTRMHLDRADRDYQNAMCREEEKREALEAALKKEFEEEKSEMENKFQDDINRIKDEYSEKIRQKSKELVEKHRKDLEQQKTKLLTEKEEAIQELSEKYRKKLSIAEEKIKDIELRHQDNLKDLKAAYDSEKSSLDKRDISNANEIEQLHRKCRCLTNLFDEMRMRYERRDPRPEDLREIAELRSRCESQERDLYELTDRLREMQIKMENLENRNGEIVQSQSGKCGNSLKKPPPKMIPTNCDVIYEENEEHDTPPSSPLTLTQ